MSVHDGPVYFYEWDTVVTVYREGRRCTSRNRSINIGYIFQRNDVAGSPVEQRNAYFQTIRT